MAGTGHLGGQPEKRRTFQVIMGIDRPMLPCASIDPTASLRDSEAPQEVRHRENRPGVRLK